VDWFKVLEERASISLAGTIEARLGGQMRVVEGPAVRCTDTYLDTFDWRVWRSGGLLVLVEDDGGARLEWSSDGRPEPDVVPVSVPVRIPDRLPSGPFRDRLEAVLGVRALLPVGQTRVVRHPLRVVDDLDKTLVRVWLEVVTDLDADGRVDGTERSIVRLERLTGYSKVYRTVVRCLDRTSGLERSDERGLEEAAAAFGRIPGDYSSKLRVHLKPDQPATVAMRTVLLELLDSIRRNVFGVIDDLDTEFLHDLRVATRRTRSALGQVKVVFPPDERRRFASEFKWLGGVTGPCRDLDVFLIELAEYLEAVPADLGDHLLRLLDHLEGTRAEVHAQLAAQLRSDRFVRLVGAWDQYLRAFPDRDRLPAGAGQPIVDLAARRIRKAYRRVLSQGSELGPQPDAQPLHRLRIEAKKLRYLLEFFTTLYPEERINRLVKELKRLQDTLGGINDTEVQQRRLRELAEEMMACGRADAETLLAMGRLEAIILERQEEHRGAFWQRFERFADRSTRAQFAELFSGEVGA